MSLIKHSEHILRDHSQPSRYRYDAAAYIVREMQRRGHYKPNQLFDLAQLGKLNVQKLQQLVGEFAAIDANRRQTNKRDLPPD